MKTRVQGARRHLEVKSAGPSDQLCVPLTFLPFFCHPHTFLRLSPAYGIALLSYMPASHDRLGAPCGLHPFLSHLSVSRDSAQCLAQDRHSKIFHQGEPRWRQVDTLHLLAQPELTENQPVRKSDTKEIKNKHSSRPVGGAEMGTGAERTRVAVAGPRLAECGTNGAGAHSVAPHSHTDKPDKWRGEKQTAQPRATAQGNKVSNL